MTIIGAFHSHLMELAQKELEEAINNTKFNTLSCAIYQYVTNLSTKISNEIL